MKLPALLVVAAFALGIALLGALPAMPAVWVALAVCCVLAGFAWFARGKLALALAAGLAAWIFLGALAITFEQSDVPEDNVAARIASGHLDTSVPLRWRGRLRSDPLRLPWGVRYEIDLDEVEAAGRPVPVSGGLRLSYYFHPGRAPEAIPALRAGDRVEALARARPPRNFGNPGAFDARTYLARDDIYLTGSLRSTELLRKLGEPPPKLSHRLARLRGTLLKKVDAQFPDPRHAAMLRAMLLGDRSFVDRELAEAFQRTAVYHVLVISGLHVAALVVFLVWCGRRLRLSPAQITVLTLVVLLAFVSIVEDRPPIARAALMAGIFLLSQLMFRRVDLLNTVAVAAAVILVLRPSALTDPSFQLSFLAAGMIGALGLPWLDRTTNPYRRALDHLDDITRDSAHAPRAAQFRLDLRAAAAWLAGRLPPRLARRAAGAVAWPARAGLRVWEVFVISFAIQLGMLPLLALYFHRVTPMGPLANIPASLLAGLIVPFGYLALGFGAVSATMGNLLARLTDALVAGLAESALAFSQWDWTSYRIPGPPGWLLAAFLASLALLSLTARSRRTSKWQLIPAGLLLALGLCVAVYPFAPRLAPKQLEVTVLDVGQGDSIFAAFPDGRTLLIDGGGLYEGPGEAGYRTGLDVGEQVVSPYLWQRGLKRLDAIALTHAHRDHLDGLNAVLENFQVDQLWVGRDVESPAFRALLARAEERGTRIVHRQRGEFFEWGGATGIVLWPEGRATVDTASNNNSLVLRLSYGKEIFLLPGDIEAPVEHELVLRDDPLEADFLKVPHHGSRTSASDEFLSAVGASVDVISVGEANPFGHPHPELLARLHRPGVRVLRTDRDGAVTVTSDGQSLWVRTFASPED